MANAEGGCANCGHLEAQVSQLRAQLAAARSENDRLRQRIERLRQALQQAREACYYYMQQTGQVLAQKSGVPRSTWAYAKGGYAVASRLWAILSQGEG